MKSFKTHIMALTLINILSLIIIGCSPQDSQLPNDNMETNPQISSLEFILIKSGKFMMGASQNDTEAYASEKPQHKVTISKDFYISKFEITQQQWQDVMGYSCYDLDRSNPYYNLPGMKERITKPNHPATVSWEDAQLFINKLNEKEGKNIYRLPTEAEWEYAAKAGSTTVYSFGNNINDLKDYAWYGGDFSTGGTHPVGGKKPNPWGLYDVHGNAWEWVQDWYSDNYYTESDVIDPKGPANGSSKVVKGGSWHATANSWRTSFKKPYEPTYRGISIGFRLVKEIQ